MPRGWSTRLDIEVFSTALSEIVGSPVLLVGVGTYTLSVPGHGASVAHRC